MATYVFEQLAAKGSDAGIPNSPSMIEARDWYRDQASKIGNVNPRRMLLDKQNLKDQINIKDIGKMYMFLYDPKLKAVLPYYDTFPLVFPLDFKANGFLGLNLHYLPPMLRASLMNNLYQTINNRKFDDSTVLNISYSILSGASRYKYFKPCVKQYLWDHVQSKYLNIEPANWDKALMLPTERFVKATKFQVWNDSKGMVR